MGAGVGLQRPRPAFIIDQRSKTKAWAAATAASPGQWRTPGIDHVALPTAGGCVVVVEPLISGNPGTDSGVVLVTKPLLTLQSVAIAAFLVQVTFTIERVARKNRRTHRFNSFIDI